MPRLAALLAAQTPPLITDRAFWGRCNDSERHAVWRDSILAVSEAADDEPPQLLASSMFECRRANDRSVSDRIHRQLNNTLSALVTHRCLQGMCKRDDRLCNWLWAVTHCPTWALTSHLPGQDLPRGEAVCIDLGVAMTGVLLAESCEQLRPWLDTQSPHFAEAILDQLEHRICRPFADGHPEWWADPETCYNNWTGVCAGGIAAVACSLGRQGRPQPRAYERALMLIDAYLKRGFTASGECDEGVGYWSYGMHYCCLGLSRVPHDELAQRIDLERLRQVARYPQRAHLFGRSHYAANDASVGFRIHPVIGANLAALCDDPYLHHLAQHDNIARPLSDHGTPTWRIIRALDALADEPCPDAALTGDAWLADQQAAIWRQVPGHPSICLTFAGGHNGECHNHNDLGHINCWHEEQPIFIDLGAPQYTADFFGPHRYEQLAASSLGHNVPIINGQQQRPGREAQAQVAGEPDANGFAMDLTAAYPSGTCQDYHRQVRFAQDGIHISERATIATDGSFVSRWWTPIEPQLTPDGIRLGGLLLRHNGSGLTTGSEDPQAHHLHGRNERIHHIDIAASPDAQGRIALDISLAAAREL